ncbi:hypothetical protein [Atlantibacter sp.]|uniref:hypothetical protein n=1 Tax=Atlantibacter sp. TaxID=1903473 RepID=UPI00289C1FEF|nr:hypothetical protein [Atlantibacter sp.]
MAGVLASTAAAVGILDKVVSITQKLANNSDELDKATLKLELVNLIYWISGRYALGSRSLYCSAMSHGAKCQRETT